MNDILSYVLNNVNITEDLRKEILDKVNLVLKFLEEDTIIYLNTNDLVDSSKITKHAEGGSFESTKIYIGDKSYKVKIADTEEKRKKGLMGVKSLPKDLGMLFIFESPGEHPMWMQDTLIPLDLIFINEEREVIKVLSREPEDETSIGVKNTKYVLEVNANSGIEKGDELELDENKDSDDIDYSPDSDIWNMSILAPDGSTLFKLQGGERIFSRKSSRVMIRKAKKADRTKSDADYASLGRYIFRELQGQTDRKPQYVNAPD